MLLVASLLSSCSNNDSENITLTNVTSSITGESEAEVEAVTEVTTETNAETTIETIVETTAETAVGTDVEMSPAERSLMTLGNNKRMKDVLTKAENGEEITIGFIGGSITEGLTAGSELCWAKLTYNWLCEQYPETTINYINAGMSGTPSQVGLIRAERDLFSGENTPDIVFIEFAVNDAQDTISRQAYEGLVNKCLAKENNPAVVLFFTMLETGYTCEEHMSAIGANYDLPMISLRSAIQPEFDSGAMVWDDYSDDESHPNEFGHAFVSDFMKNYFTKAAAADAPDDYQINSNPLYSKDFMNMQLIDSKELNVVSTGSFIARDNILAQFPNDWVHRGGGNDSFICELEFDELFLLFHCNNNEKYGAVEVYVDGELMNTVDSNRSGGWSNPEAQYICSFDSSEKHTVEIKMAEGDEDDYFAILGFGYCNNN